MNFLRIFLVKQRKLAPNKSFILTNFGKLKKKIDQHYAHFNTGKIILLETLIGGKHIHINKYWELTKRCQK